MGCVQKPQKCRTIASSLKLIYLLMSTREEDGFLLGDGSKIENLKISH